MYLEDEMVKNKWAALVLFVVAFVVCWNVLDLLYATVVTQSGYQFHAGTDGALPLVVSAVVGYLLFVRGK